MSAFNGCDENGISYASTSSASIIEASDGLRTQQGRLSKIVVLEVNSENLDSIWPYLLVCIKNSSFISLDLELSGLGIQKGWSAQSVEDRYRVICDSAKSRAVLSVGVSTFQLLKRKETDKKKRIKYKCQVFNILALSAAPFTVEPDGLQFLAQHNFDFNRLINLGVPYGRNAARKNGKAKQDVLTVLWGEILSACVPITLHNGIIDLAFIYQHFYSDLPEKLDEFLANICDWFTLDESGTPGLFDSKYLAECSAYMKASYLEYVFRKCQRDNATEASSARAYISLEFDDLTMANDRIRNAVDVIDCRLPDEFLEAAIVPRSVSEKDAQMICKNFAAFGFCKPSQRCCRTHNMDLILDLEEQKQSKASFKEFNTLKDLVRQRRRRRYDYASKRIRTGEEQEHDAAPNSSKHSDVEEELTLEGTSPSSLVTNDSKMEQVEQCVDLDQADFDEQKVKCRPICEMKRTVIGKCQWTYILK
ncbi:Target of EGR1 protein 1 [Toxocara canis]|uniref:Target of EGR1 protein 1 n=1 Tax=Toxocara canis TaxID=6265 RepID=A0A0B2UZZ0_TOXCA|nr:Target of EGR1 protein 1 [Toxocara canis]